MHASPCPGTPCLCARSTGKSQQATNRNDPGDRPAVRRHCHERSLITAQHDAPAGKPGGYYGPWYSSSGMAVNVGNTAELEPTSKEAQDPEARWAGTCCLGERSGAVGAETAGFGSIWGGLCAPACSPP